MAAIETTACPFASEVSENAAFVSAKGRRTAEDDMRCGAVWDGNWSRKQFLLNEKSATCACVRTDGSQTTGF